MAKTKNEAGSSLMGTPIVSAISMFLIALLVITVVNIILPFVWYEKLSLESLKYIFIMEEYGYLTPEEKNNLIRDLDSQHFDVSKVDIAATEAPAEYGEPIFLNITYSYSYKLPTLNAAGLSALNQQNVLEMFVRRQSVSKR